MAHNNLINFEGSRFRDPLPSIGEVVSEIHMGVCTEERPVMHWVSKMKIAHATASHAVVATHLENIIFFFYKF